MKTISLILMITFCQSLFSQVSYSFVTLLSEKRAYLSSEGEITYTEGKGERIYPLNEGYGMIVKNDKFGFIDPKGEIKIPIMYNGARGFSDGLAAVKIDSMWAFINHNNEIVFKTENKVSGDFVEGKAYFRKGRNYGFIDKTGNVVIEPKYEYVKEFQDGYTLVRVDGKWGCINAKGETVIEPKFERMSFFKYGHSWVYNNHVWGCMDDKGKYIVQPLYEDTQNEMSGYTWMKKGGFLWSMVDSLGNVVIAPSAKNSTLFALRAVFSSVRFTTPGNGLMVINSATKSGYCDLKQNMVLPQIYDDASDFVDGYAMVKLKGKWGVIDTTGKLLIDYKYDELKYLQCGVFASIRGNGDALLIDKNGKQLNEQYFFKIKEFKTM